MRLLPLPLSLVVAIAPCPFATAQEAASRPPLHVDGAVVRCWHGGNPVGDDACSRTSMATASSHR